MGSECVCVCGGRSSFSHTHPLPPLVTVHSHTWGSPPHVRSHPASVILLCTEKIGGLKQLAWLGAKPREPWPQGLVASEDEQVVVSDSVTLERKNSPCGK